MSLHLWCSLLYLQLQDKTNIENKFTLIDDNFMFYVTLRWSGLIVLRSEAQPCPVFKDESVSYKNGQKSSSAYVNLSSFLKAKEETMAAILVCQLLVFM